MSTDYTDYALNRFGKRFLEEHFRHLKLTRIVFTSKKLFASFSAKLTAILLSQQTETNLHHQIFLFKNTAFVAANNPSRKVLQNAVVVRRK